MIKPTGALFIATPIPKTHTPTAIEITFSCVEILIILLLHANDELQLLNIIVDKLI